METIIITLIIIFCVAKLACVIYDAGKADGKTESTSSNESYTNEYAAMKRKMENDSFHQ